MTSPTSTSRRIVSLPQDGWTSTSFDIETIGRFHPPLHLFNPSLATFSALSSLQSTTPSIPSVQAALTTWPRLRKIVFRDCLLSLGHGNSGASNIPSLCLDKNQIRNLIIIFEITLPYLPSYLTSSPFWFFVVGGLKSFTSNPRLEVGEVVLKLEKLDPRLVERMVFGGRRSSRLEKLKEKVKFEVLEG